MRCANRFPVLVAALAFVALTVVTASADIRLDSRVAPTFESVELDLDANRTEYTGSVRIELEVRESTDSFQFHAEEMNLDKVVLSDSKGPIAVTVEDGEEGLRTISCERTLKKGPYVLEIDFSKDYNTKSVGLYRVEAEGQGYIFSQFQDVDARKAFPCWDEPIYKIPFQVTVTVPIQQVAVSNTPVGKQTMGADTKTYHFKKTPPMPSYLVVICAGPLESVAIPGLSVPGRIYTVKGQKHLTKLAADYAPPILDALEEYFGVKYPYEKLDLVAVPEFWPGAMENAGCVTYRDRILLIDPDAASMSQKRFLARVHAHEFAHMWFGDYVTMEWWDDLWLNESFADWMGDRITEQLYPELKIALTELQDVQGLMLGDARPSTVPVRKPIESTADLMDGVMLAYGKGKTILHMVEVWIGSDRFREGVRNYINANAWGSTVADDLFQALSHAADQDLTPILSTFLEQPGYPTVALDLEPGGVISLTQKRYLNYGIDAENLMWTIPVWVKYSDGKELHTRKVLLDKERTQIEVGTNVDWAMPGAGAYGYYRWSAPPDMLFKIASDPAKNLDERERAVFLGNALALLTAGEISGDEYLTMIAAFASHTSPEIVDGVMDGLSAVGMAFVTEDIRDGYAHYVRETLGPAYKRYGINPTDGEPEAVSIMRPRLIRTLGDWGQMKEVRDECRTMSKAYLADPSSVDATIAGSALRVAAIDGTNEDFDALYKHATETDVPADRARCLGALGYFSDPELQERALGITGEIRPNEVFPIIQGISRTEVGRTRAFNWMMENYDQIAARLPDFYMSYMPYYASGCSQAILARAQEFFAQPEHNVPGTDKSIKKVTEQVTDCTNLREREGPAVADYLSRLAAR